MFRAFTTSGTGLRLALNNDVQIAAGFDPARLEPERHPPFVAFRATWDTGATESVITQSVVDACNMKPTGMTLVSHAQGESMAETYLANIGLPNGVAFVNLKVTKGILKGSDVLVGMDIITQGDFAVTNVDGKTVFSFRVPSIQRIDYVKAAQALNPATRASVDAGRNDPCPCGSGKKYKKCCGG
jgi:hypothetical protein